MIRRLISRMPAPVKRALRLGQRHVTDLINGQKRRMITLAARRSLFPAQKIVIQKVRPGNTLKAKLHNMQKGIERMEQIEIPTGRIFSFWNLVGQPGARQGFLPGRNIVNGQLIEDYGGGLCQLSSAMYELALRSGLEVLERHAHSTNVYTSETSYTTLGLDATLAYGYKDFRLRNNFPFPICFSFQLTDTELQVGLCAPSPFPELPVRVEQKHSDSGLMAKVFRTNGETEVLLTSDFYRAWKEEAVA